MTPDVSVVIVSFNTCKVLRDCLHALGGELEGLVSEVFVVDNASRDNSVEMVRNEFPGTKVLASEVNLGFAGANNLAFPHVCGRYVILLNSDAFLTKGSLLAAVKHMDAELTVGLGGARLVGPDHTWQPSARLFPSPLNDFLMLSGLSARFPKSRFFGRFDRTWADQNLAADVDWVPGAFSIIRTPVLKEVGYFDERFFLYYEEVDLCRRIIAAGHRVSYWPDIVVIHLGGESSKTVSTLQFSTSGAQLVLWRIRSAFLYYRKHHGWVAWLAKEMERAWYGLRAAANLLSATPASRQKAAESRVVIRLLDQAWRETAGGGVSPARPW